MQAAAPPIWFQSISVERIQPLYKGTAISNSGIEVIEIGPDFLKARMPVDQRTIQPVGLLHGGSSVLLAETLGSLAAGLCIDPKLFSCVGLEVNANHVRGVRSGFVIGTARPMHLGKSTQVWEIRIVDEQERLVSVARLTVAVLVRQDVIAAV